MNPSRFAELGQCIDSIQESTIKLEKHFKDKDEKNVKEIKNFILKMQLRIDELLK